MLSSDNRVETSVSPSDLLTKLSQVLNCPIETFFDSASHNLGPTVEFLKLWSEIDNPSDRAKLLAVARVLAAKG
ncbi:hypothetical protein FV222_16760 [Methylobacterium sp. WL103]|uniref:hypothetical protein n=1 Tax=Methylobacterium sp. WL103 TaxID=2603891 RepID=UPI0011C903CC|nr:hypothetical protein [Methylobacterium sp. WL103]TXM97073.1 hypothetical protein FV222_16760 [Methylobacterium sp. WL103]